MTPAQLTDLQDAARWHVLGQYRRQRRLGRGPQAAMRIVRDAHALMIAELVCMDCPVSDAVKERYRAALEYTARICERPIYWHMPAGAKRHGR